MFTRYLRFLSQSPNGYLWDTEAATTDNAAGSSGSTSGVMSTSSGTASAAMIAAATAASSAETPSAGAAAEAVQPGTSAGTTGAATPAATGQPEKKTETPAATGGAVPLDRHETAVKNARAAGAAEAVKGLEWASELRQQGVTPQQVNTALRFFSAYGQNPRAFYTELGKRLGIAERPKIDLRPGLRSEDGREAYTAEQVQEIVGQQLEKLREELTGQVTPLLDAHRQSLEERRRMAETGRAQKTAQDALDYARSKFKHFNTKENEAAVMERVSQIPREERIALGPFGVLSRAYNEFVNEVILPRQEQEMEQQLQDRARKQAATSVGSAHPVSSQPEVKRPRTIEGPEQFASRMAELEKELTSA